MRRIDQSKIAPDPAWDTLSTTETAKVLAGTPVKDCNSIWGNTKDRLKKVSHSKCWYCEARQERSDNAVDHFRPKSIYPWLAFTLSNFRYACTFCNSIRTNPDTGESSGKGNHFPLFNGVRATDVASLNIEEVVLIDPCVATEPGLLDFKDDGTPCAKYPTQPKRNQKAIDSIRYYHLDHPALNENRRLLALQIKDWVEGADAIYPQADQGNPNVEKAFSKFVESIGRTISESAEFSVFAKRMLEGYRNLPWVEDLLQCA